MNKRSSHRGLPGFATLARRFPQLGQWLRQAGEPVSRLIVEDGKPVNIDLGGALLYPESEPVWTAARLEAFAVDPDRLGFADTKNCNLSPVSLKLQQNIMSYLGDEGLLKNLARLPVVDVGYLFVFGVGLGTHLPTLLATTPARHVVLIEPYPEFFLHSLATIDWRALFKVADRRNITLHAITQADPDKICEVIEHVVSTHGNVFIEGSYFFCSYYCWAFKEAILRLRDNLKNHYITSGFFEDEIEMLRNSHGNIRNQQRLKILEPKLRRQQSHPVILVGAGPSLDHDMPYLQSLRDRAIIVSCGTSIGILLKNGIRPDLHVEIERGALVYELLAKVRDTYGFEGITLIASSTVDPRVPSLFDDAWFFIRGGLSPSAVLMRGFQDLRMVDPLCCNAAFASVAALGFRNIWLFGLDLAQKEDGCHHARDSVYYQPEHKKWDDDYRRRFDRIVPGNFGGEVRTFWAFDSGRYSLAKAQQYYGVSAVNCSDGAVIVGAQPKVAAAVTLPPPALPREAVLERLAGTLTTVETADLLDKADLDDVLDQASAYLACVDRVVEEWLASEEEFFELETRLVDAICGEHFEEFKRFHVIVRGSLMAMVRLGAFFGTRIAGVEQRRRYQRHFAACFRARCAEMEDITRDLLASLDGGRKEGIAGCPAGRIGATEHPCTV